MLDKKNSKYHRQQPYYKYKTNKTTFTPLLWLKLKQIHGFNGSGQSTLRIGRKRHYPENSISCHVLMSLTQKRK